MKKIINILILSLMLTGCTSVEYIQPTLPEFNPARPSRPVLETVEEEVPYKATVNTIKLMEYARQLEVYSNSWEIFYTQLQEDLTIDA